MRLRTLPSPAAVSDGEWMATVSPATAFKPQPPECKVRKAIGLASGALEARGER